jgi:predicted AlkP superfamily phosphohydrolase/phosphomutase
VKRAPVVMIGLDAAELTLIERLCAEGVLPTLQSLRDRGCFGPLASDASIFAGGVWPTFYTAQAVPWHGIYHNILWRPERMRCEVVNDTWLPERPFWEGLDPDAYRIAVIDVPMVAGVPRAVNGIQVAGWGTHDVIAKGAWPPDLWRQLETDFGPPLMSSAIQGPQSAKTLLRLRDLLLETTDQMARLSASLLAREAWDLFVVVFGATHRGGHYLWDVSQFDGAHVPVNARRILDRALVDLYQACDRAIAQLLERAAADARILVFAVHGMGPNPGWVGRCPEILSRIQPGPQGARGRPGLLHRLAKAIPRPLKRQLKGRIARRSQGTLDRISLWYANAHDWTEHRCFPLPMDLAGYLRINVKGREARGIVEPGPEYRALCEELHDAFLSFRDVATGRPIVDRVYRLDDLAPPDAPYRELLPDLVIAWDGVSAQQSRAIHSPRYGEMRWETDERLAYGRSGDHRERGWLLAAGEGIDPATRVEGHHIRDLVPTVFRWLGARPHATFQGRPIPALCEGDRPTSTP